MVACTLFRVSKLGIHNSTLNTWQMWGCGAAGSAREWHSRGRGFNPRQLHQKQDKGWNPRPGVPKGVCPLRGEYARGLAPSARVGEKGFLVRTDEGARFNLRQLHQKHDTKLA